MSNHEHRCRGCGEDQRRLGDAHEANCLARELDVKSKARDECERQYQGKVAEVLEVMGQRDEFAYKLDGAIKDAAQLRELLTMYNLGGWTDSERLIKERDEARKEIEQWRQHAEERVQTFEIETANLRAENEALRTRNDLLANRAYPPERDWGL